MKKLLIMAVCIAFFFSCKKDNNSENSNANSEYLPMALGNYWITKDFYTNSEGRSYSTDEEDSVIIVNDTVINNNTFRKFNTYRKSKNRIVWFIGSNFYRDSAKCLVTNEGKVLFSENNFTDILLTKSEIVDTDTLFSMLCKMEKMDSSVTVPAGLFSEILNLRGLVNCNPKYTSIPNPRISNNIYAKNVGKIYASYTFLENGEVKEIKLVRFHVLK